MAPVVVSKFAHLPRKAERRTPKSFQSEAQVWQVWQSSARTGNEILETSPPHPSCSIFFPLINPAECTNQFLSLWTSLPSQRGNAHCHGPSSSAPYDRLARCATGDCAGPSAHFDVAPRVTRRHPCMSLQKLQDSAKGSNARGSLLNMLQGLPSSTRLILIGGNFPLTLPPLTTPPPHSRMPSSKSPS